MWSAAHALQRFARPTINSYIRHFSVLCVFGCVTANTALAVDAGPATAPIQQRLLTAYPSIISAIEGNEVVFADGTRLPFDDQKGSKNFSAWVEAPDIEDMFRLPYPAGTPAAAPAQDFDPGRARNAAFFKAVYGDCTRGGVEKNLVPVAWLPKKKGQRLWVTKINGVADRLKAVSDALDQLPPRFDVFLFPSAGTYNCRTVAGTKFPSAHGYGIAIDIALKHAHYWRWMANGPASPIRYENEIPAEIVAAFEAQGFIWGGRWHHYDTMHFEYRPELLPAAH
jgi:D-alanyl-D-alanine carboxypeptidase